MTGRFRGLNDMTIGENWKRVKIWCGAQLACTVYSTGLESTDNVRSRKDYEWEGKIGKWRKRKRDKLRKRQKDKRR